MSTVVWCEIESRDNTPPDMPLLFQLAGELDKLSPATGQAAFSDLLDSSDMEFNLSDEELPESWLKERAKWLDPLRVREHLLNLRREVASGTVVSDTATKARLEAEINGVLEVCSEAVKEGKRVRLLVVI